MHPAGYLATRRREREGVGVRYVIYIYIFIFTCRLHINIDIYTHIFKIKYVGLRLALSIGSLRRANHDNSTTFPAFEERATILRPRLVQIANTVKVVPGHRRKDWYL